MKIFSLMALVLALGLGLAVGDAEAKRMGGGKSVGMQRQSASADKAPGSTTTPAQAAPASAAAAPAAAGAAAAGTAAAASKRSWMGPLAGIAAGLGIAALASHLGFGEELASMLMMGLLAVAVLAAVGWFMRRRAAAGAGGMSRTAYAGAGAGAGGMPEPVQAFEAARPAQGGSLIGANLQPGAVAAIPSDFDVATFVRNAKVQFVRLQAAHDAGNLDDIRAFTTPEMFAEIRMDVSERGAAEQHTEVLQLDAEVLSVQEDGLLYVASVRFHGQLREERNGAPSDVDEVWHLTKPRAGSSGWVLAGIQQRG